MTNKEAVEVLRSMKSDFPLPKAAQTRRAQNDALDVAIEALKAEPCEDAVSRQAAIDVIEAGRLTKLIDAETAVNGLKALPSAQPEIIRCKDCKHFEYNYPYVIQGIPVLGHEVCNAWGDGCKTDENGYCFMAERRTDVNADA